MFLVYDNASNNVLAEYDSFHEAEQRRIQIVGANPFLSESILVLDFGSALERYREQVACETAASA